MIIMDNNKEIISGLAFHKISEWSLCGRYQTKYSLEDIKENDKIFINLDGIYSFADELKKNPPKNKFILITHNSDGSFREEHCNIINPFVNKIYAINNITNLPNVFSIPIGLRDWPNHTSSVIQTIDIEKNKENLLYMNFVVHTNFQKRLECLNCFIGKEWVLYKQNVSIHEFYRDISKSKYVLSPQGTGIDCHRIYESMYFDSIPILKTNPMDSFYKELPVIIVEDWNEITYDFLEKNYNFYYDNLVKWKKNNPDWLYPNFWLK